MLQKGFRPFGVLYDHQSNHLLVCDSGNGKIIELDPNSGMLLFHSLCNNNNFIIEENQFELCDIPEPYQITQSAPNEYLVTNSFKVSIIVKEGIQYIFY